MGNYQFEVTLTVSDIIDVQADSIEEAMTEAHEQAESYYPVHPAGFSFGWHNVDVLFVSGPEDEE